VLTVVRYSTSLIRMKINFKVQHSFLELLTMLENGPLKMYNYTIIIVTLYHHDDVCHSAS